MKFYFLHKIDGATVQKEITSHVELNASGNERKDETLETLSFTLSPITREECYEPGSCVRVEYDDDSTKDFAIVSDNVSLIQRGAKKAWSHNIQCVQWARTLCYKLLRGTDLSQPYQAPRKAAVCNSIFSYCYGEGKKEYTDNWTYKRNLDLRQPPLKPFERVMAGGVVTMNAYLLYLPTKPTGEVITGTYYVKNPTSGITPPSIISSSTGVSLVTLSDLTGHGKKHVITPAEASIINQAIDAGATIGLKNNDQTGLMTSDNEPQMHVCLRYDTDTYRFTYADVLRYISHACSTSYYASWSPDESAQNPTINSVMVPEKSLFSIPTSGAFADVLKNIAPDFQFQQNTTAYDAVCEVLRMLGGKPTLDFNGTLGIEYFNERTKEINKVDFVEETRSVSDSKRSNAVVVPYQNGVPKTSVDYPTQSGGVNSYVTPRCKNVGIPSEKDWYFIMGAPINQVRNLSIRMNNLFPLDAGLVLPKGDGTYYKQLIYVEWGEYGTSADDVSRAFDLDITDFLFDSDAYSLLDSSKKDEPTLEATQVNSLQYSKGDNAIYVGDIWKNNIGLKGHTMELCVKSALSRILSMHASYTTGNEEWGGWENEKPWTYPLRCSYYPMAQGNMRIESPIPKNYGDDKETEITIAQGGGIVSLERMGLSALGTVSMLGEETMANSYRAFAYTDKKPLAGMWLKDGDDYWIVQEAKSTLLKDGIYKATMVLSKNFNKVPDRVRLDRAVRMTNISQELVLRSEHMMRDYIYFGHSFPNATLKETSGPQYQTLLSKNGFTRLYAGILNHYWGTRTQKNMLFKKEGETNYIIMPLVCYASGNAICFEANFQSSISAGTHLETATGWGDNDVTISKITPYADANGYIKSFDFAILDEDASIDFSKAPYAKWNNSTYPFKGKLAGATSVLAYKNPNDILGLNYETIFLPYDGLIIYDGLAYRSPYASGVTWQPMILRVNTSEKPYSMFETNGRGTIISNNVDFALFAQNDSDGNAYRMLDLAVAVDNSTRAHLTASSACNGWMLTDGSGKPLLASNKPLSKNSEIKFYAFASHKRL